VAAGRKASAFRREDLWRLIAVLAVVASGILGAAVVHAVDQGNAARDQYTSQVLTTVTRFDVEALQQASLPAAQHNATAFLDLASSINEDPGVNGAGTLRMSVGAGDITKAGVVDGTGPVTQWVFEVHVDSPYASSAFVAWSVYGKGFSDVGACVLSSSLLGQGRASTSLTLAMQRFVQPCEPQWWMPSDTYGNPRFDLAGIPTDGS
jgi:hypothetical protein